VDLDLTEAQKALRDQARDVALREIAGKAAEIDRRQRFPGEMVAQLGKLGMLAVTVPKAWGGLGLDMMACTLMTEELASACASTGAIVALQNVLVCEPILRFGSEAQKSTWLPLLATGAQLGCFALTESTGGTDPLGVSSVARREGDEWILQGSKSFVTCGPSAQVAIVFATTKAGADDVLSAFLVPTDSPGLSFGPVYDKLGLRGAIAASMTLDNVRLPATALLGAAGEGADILRVAGEGGRIGAAAVALGVARAAFAVATSYAISRRSHGEAISEHQAIQFKLADMATKIDAARLLIWQAASLKDQKKDFVKAAAMAKLFASQIAQEVTTEAVQIHGGYGYVKEFHVERLMRDAKITQIYEGTTEIQKMVISRELLR